MRIHRRATSEISRLASGFSPVLCSTVGLQNLPPHSEEAAPEQGEGCPFSVPRESPGIQSMWRGSCAPAQRSARASAAKFKDSSEQDGVREGVSWASSGRTSPLPAGVRPQLSREPSLGPPQIRQTQETETRVRIRVYTLLKAVEIQRVSEVGWGRRFLAVGLVRDETSRTGILSSR